MGWFKSQSEKNDEAYAEGYKDGKEGWLLTDFVESVAESTPLPSTKAEECYGKGYAEGKRHRHDD